MAELGDLAAPVVGAATGLHGHRAGRQRCEERQKLAAAQLLAKDHRARAVSPMELKDVLGEIEADGANLVHGRLLEWALTPPLWHAEAVGGVHTIRPQGRALPWAPGPLLPKRRGNNKSQPTKRQNCEKTIHHPQATCGARARFQLDRKENSRSFCFSTRAAASGRSGP